MITVGQIRAAIEGLPDEAEAVIDGEYVDDLDLFFAHVRRQGNGVAFEVDSDPAEDEDDSDDFDDGEDDDDEIDEL